MAITITTGRIMTKDEMVQAIASLQARAELGRSHQRHLLKKTCTLLVLSISAVAGQKSVLAHPGKWA